MQYQVPQFIETEDRVVGPFSIRQFIYVGVAALVTGICYFFVQTWLFAVVAVVTIGGALAFSFLKINGRPLIKVVTSAFNFYWKPQLYIWKSEHPVASVKRTAPASVRELPPIKKPQAAARTVVHELTPEAIADAQAEQAEAQKQAQAQLPEAQPGPTMVSTAASATDTTDGETEREVPEAITLGSSLHKSWENLQTGTPAPDAKKTSDRQFIEKKMSERYQIFRRQSGERTAARRVDYR
jgi:hypothetical protein